MKAVIASSQVFSYITLICLTFCGSLAGQSSNASRQVYLLPGADIQAAVDSAPEQTAFVLRSGLYRGQSISPKNGDSFAGEGDVILNGAKILTFTPVPNLAGFWVASAEADISRHGPCQNSSPLCAYTQDLFLDNEWQHPVSDLSGLKDGSWYFDRANGKVFISVNPAHHLVELGMLPDAFHGSAAHVHLRDLIVEKYASQAQHGAVGGNRAGSSWIVDKVEIRWNHGGGCDVGPNSRILHSYIHHNGQLGLASGGLGVQVIGNEISFNNYAGYSASWEAGGTKFWATTNLLVRSNYVHDNDGPGLWTDTDNVGTIYEDNTVVNNKYSGIQHEVSFAAVIRNNTIKGNGNGPTAHWLWNAQIQIQNSSNVKVYGNTVQVPAAGGNGIAVVNQNRGGSSIGEWVGANNYVHDNVVTYLGQEGASGFVDDTGQKSSRNNRFDHNRYVLVGDGSYSHWDWLSSVTWKQLRALGQEAHGTCCN